MTHSNFKNICTAVVLLASMVGVASAQEKLDRTVLPIQEPERPTYSELDVRNVEAPPRFEVKAPENAPNVVIVLIDDIGFGGPSTFGGPIQTPTLDQPGRGRAALQQLPHHGALLTDAERAQDRSQPSHHQHRFDHGDCNGLPRQHRAGSEQRCATGRDAPAQRLQHRCVRQVARDRRLGDQRVGSLRPLAHPPGLRQVLRLHRGRDRSVVSADLRRRHQGHSAADRGLPLHRRHDQPGDQLGEGPAVDDAGQAVLRVLRHRRRPRTAPRAQGVGGQVQGPVRQGLGPGSAGDGRAAEADGRHPGGHASWPTKPEDIKDWDTLPGGPAAPVRPPGRGVRRVPGADRPRGRPLRRRRWRTSARWTTPCSSTSPATTAPAPRAASSACTTR